MNAQRGVALIMWMFIVMLVLFAIAAVLGYTQFEKVTELNDELAASQASLEAKQAELQKVINERTDIYMKVGYGAKEIGQKSDIPAIEQDLARLRGKFPTVTDADKNLESVLNGVEKAYDDQVVAATDAKQQASQWRTDKEAAEEAKNQIVGDKDKEIGDLNSQIRSEQERAARNLKQAQDTIDQQRERITQLETEVADTAAQWKKEKNELTNKLMAMDAIVEGINKRNRIIREKNGPDGAIVDADDQLGLVYIDIGSKNGLKRGTPFDVWSYGKGKVKLPKGKIEVREVHDDYAVAGITNVIDPLNPITKGDQVSNPYFDRGKAPEFVFLGDLPGRFSNEEATKILESKGAVVAKKVTANTDFLVVGKQTSAEGNAVDLEETEPFRLATLYGVEILRGPELTQYLQY